MFSSLLHFVIYTLAYTLWLQFVIDTLRFTFVLYFVVTLTGKFHINYCCSANYRIWGAVNLWIPVFLTKLHEIIKIERVWSFDYSEIIKEENGFF